MGKIYDFKQTKWDGGISDDVRQPSSNKGAMVKHFDIFSNPYKLTPFRATEADVAIGGASTALLQYDARDFQPHPTSDNWIYCLGNSAGISRNGYPIVFKRYLLDGYWTISATAVATAVIQNGSFKEWNGDFYFFNKG